MQDISLMPAVDIPAYLAALKDKPLDEKMMRGKIDKIECISTFNEHEYLPEVVELYAWTAIANHHLDFREMLASEKLQKPFCEEFLMNCAKRLILCRKFYMIQLMVVTQQFLVECLVFFNNHFHELDRYPKLIQLPRIVLEIERQFYKLNYITDYPHMIVQPTKEEVDQNQKFVEKLKVGDEVDALKIDLYGKRMVWSRAKINKIGYASNYVEFLHDRNSADRNVDKRGFELAPVGTFTKDDWDWRLNVKVGDWVDYEESPGSWLKIKVEEVRQSQDDKDRQYSEVRFEKEKEEADYYSSDWSTTTSPKIQKPGFITATEPEGRKLLSHQVNFDDYNDIILDPQYKAEHAIIRPQNTKSVLFAQLVNKADELGIWSKILVAVRDQKVPIQVCADLIGLVNSIQMLFNRRYALVFLKDLADAIMNYIKNIDQSNIRNFSKERLQCIMLALYDFYKRLVSARERKNIIETLRMDLALRFINSDFLERKMHAVTTITELIRLSKHHSNNLTYDQICNWIVKNEIIRKIFNEKSHPELITRATDLIKIYLLEQPPIQTLEPFLQTSQTILKVSNELLDHFPKAFRASLVQKITSKKDVTNKDALDIVKKFGGNQLWLLKNGGEGWVDVVRQKKKRAEDFKYVLEQPFDVVMKITRQVNSSHDDRFRTEFFEMLENTKYLLQVIDMEIGLHLKIEFCGMMVNNTLSIPEELFQKLLELWESQQMETVDKTTVQFYDLVLGKLDKEQTQLFFSKFFSKIECLKKLNENSFMLFRSFFLRVNQFYDNIQRKSIYCYPDASSIKKEHRSIVTITVNPNKLIGMTELMNVIFENQELVVIQRALEFIAFLFDHLAKHLVSSIKDFKENFMQQCLDKLYTSTSYQKYLKIIGNILDESEKEGNGGLVSLETALPPQKQRILIVDGFNAVKKKMIFEGYSNITVYELRFNIGKEISAFIHEMNIYNDDKLLDERFNGYTLHQANLKGPLVIERCGKIQRASLTENGKLTPEALRIFERIFRQNSTDGLMSKQECQKYHQKCVGDVSSIGESKVEKIYEKHDTNKDGYLSLDDFVRFYENSIKDREMTVWNNLETLGIRNDLKILDDLEMPVADPHTLIRFLLLHDQKFMDLLFQILHSENVDNRKAAWALLERLPLCEDTKCEFDLTNQYALRYWLYIVDKKQDYDKITHERLEQILDSDKETLAIGLKVASNIKGLDLPIFKRLIGQLTYTNSRQELDFYDKIILDYSLNLIVTCLQSSEQVRSEYISRHKQYEQLFLTGLMSANLEVREMYCEASRKILSESVESNFSVFEIMFRMIYSNFEKCNKSSLYIQYFELFSSMLEMLHSHPGVLARLELNWVILTKSIIDLFKAHKCTEERMSSSVDWVAQGFMRTLSKLLHLNTLDYFIDLVQYLFQNLLFPEGGLNKLKTPTTRKEAYELVYKICAMGPNEKGVSGLDMLFGSGFRKIYKTMSSTKVQSYSIPYSYYSSYNEIRSELGYAGIRNLGCICYMIAMIQQFYLTKPFRYLMLMADDGQPECLVKRGLKEIDDNILHQFQNMFANLELTERQEFNPDDFCFAFKDIEGNPVNVSIQQDAQEFLNMIFDKLEKGLKDTPFRHILDSVYGGRSCSQLTCSSCKAVKEREENFYNLSLEVKGFRNIDESFRKFISGETISDYRCDSCSQKCDTIKRCLLSGMPNYLIIHLQRICFNYDTFQNEKVNSRWEFPQQLNVYPYTAQKEHGVANSDDFEYQLKGIVVHIGSAEYGHYFSFIKCDTQWLEFNDERVKEFDPKDIETECFGGEHWRRENQSAYLLLYEKKVKSKVLLEFQTLHQQQQIAKLAGLKGLQPYEEPKKVEVEAPPVVEKEEETEKQTEDSSSQVTQEEAKVEEPPAPKIRSVIDFSQVPYFVPDKLVAKINKSNEEFSMNLNVSNNEFAQFVYRILSIDPPKSLKTEFLELCYECFHFKQHIDSSEMSLSDWMAKRFRQLIIGSGWEFLASISSWQKDILSHEKATRTSMRNLLISVVSDIVATYHFNDFTHPKDITEEIKKKMDTVLQFLDAYLALIHSDVPRNWVRYQEYFEVWAELIRQSDWIRKYAYTENMVSILFGFILQNYSPFKSTTHRVQMMGTKYNIPSYEYPLEVLALLIRGNYTMTALQIKCLGHYVFLDKLTKHHPRNSKIIEIVCRNHPVNSERLGYLILHEITKVAHSDEVKPIIEAIHQFLDIKDDLSQQRLEWIMGCAQPVYQSSTNSFCLYGMHSLNETAFNFKSPLRCHPILQMNLMMEKNQHISALLISMLLQLEKDGVVSLNDYPPQNLLNDDYTSEWNQFVNGYYEDNRKAYRGSQYLEYGERIKELWSTRQPKPKLHKNWLIGATIGTVSSETSAHNNIEVEFVDYTVAVLESKATCRKNDAIPSELVYQRMAINNSQKILSKYKNSELFINKSGVTYPHSSYDLSDDEEQPTQTDNPFEHAKKAEMVRRIIVKNQTKKAVIVVLKLQSTSANVWPVPSSAVTFALDIDKEDSIYLMKEDPFGEWGSVTYTVEAYPTSSRNLNDEYPKQIITLPPQESEIEVHSDDESHY